MAAESNQWTLHVKHGGNGHIVHVPANATGTQLLEAVAAATGGLARSFKVIHKGKVLGAGSLAQQGVEDGAKIMALGGGAQVAAGASTAGAKVANAAAQAKADEARSRLEAHYAAARGGGAAASLPNAAGAPKGVAAGSSVLSHLPERHRAWRATGIMALRELGLTALSTALVQAPSPEGGPPPGASRSHADSEEEAAWGSWAGSIRAVDACHNTLTSVPAALATLGSTLTGLKLSHNQLTTEGIPWAALASLQGLTHLAVDHNRLTSISTQGGWMQTCAPRLRVLHLSHNQLREVPAEVGTLTALQLLTLDSNQLTALPDALGSCVALVELSAQDNHIPAIPAALATCTSLQCLRLERNKVSAIPPGLLPGLGNLWLLQLSGNAITIEQLREADGFTGLDQRRRARATKQIEGGVLLDGSSAFSEGADAQEFNHWRSPTGL